MSPTTTRLLVVSNRLPTVLEKKDSGWILKPGSGGLVSALALVVLLSPTWAQDKKETKKAEKAKDLIVGKWAPTKEKDKDKGVLEFTKDGKVAIKITAPAPTPRRCGACGASPGRWELKPRKPKAIGVV